MLSPPLTLNQFRLPRIHLFRGHHLFAPPPRRCPFVLIFMLTLSRSPSVLEPLHRNAPEYRVPNFALWIPTSSASVSHAIFSPFCLFLCVLPVIPCSAVQTKRTQSYASPNALLRKS